MLMLYHAICKALVYGVSYLLLFRVCFDIYYPINCLLSFYFNVSVNCLFTSLLYSNLVQCVCVNICFYWRGALLHLSVLLSVFITARALPHFFTDYMYMVLGHFL